MKSLRGVTLALMVVVLAVALYCTVRVHHSAEIGVGVAPTATPTATPTPIKGS